MENPFTIGTKYTRKDIYEILNVPENRQKGAWNTGYREYEGSIYIFVNVNTPGREGTDHNNKWEGDILHWNAKAASDIHQKTIRELMDPAITKHVFTRTDNRAPFIYEGKAAVFSFKDKIPVQIDWEFHSLNDIDNLCESEETSYAAEKYTRTQIIHVNSYERNREARRICIGYHGCKCKICGFDYEKFYGKYAENFIQVHYIKPEIEIGEDYVFDPIRDMIPVCANCHSVIHRKKRMLTVEEIKAMVHKKEK